MIASTNLEKPKRLNSDRHTPNLFQRFVKILRIFDNKYFMPIFKTLYFFCIVLNSCVLVKEAQKYLKNSNFCDTGSRTRIRTYWKTCIPPKFVLRQTIFIGIKKQHTRFFLSTSVKEKVYT